MINSMVFNIEEVMKPNYKELANRLVHMLLKLPIMLWSNAPEFWLFSNYAPYASKYAPQFISFLLNHKIMSISSLLFIYFPNTGQFCLSISVVSSCTV